MTAAFVDPRNRPDPEAPRPAARFTSDASELAKQHRCCSQGRLYDVERWIQADLPLQLEPSSPTGRPRCFRTALEIALERQDQSLLLLLLSNGYDMAAEPTCPLDTALRLRRRDLLDLLLAWGADPRQVNLDLLCDTYDSELYERFRLLGVDLTSGHALAYALGSLSYASLTGLNHIALRVTDVERSRDFYVRHLGLEVANESLPSNSFLTCGDQFVALFRGRAAGLAHYCYSIDDYDQQQAATKLRGENLVPSLQANRIYFQDPDGLTVQLASHTHGP